MAAVIIVVVQAVEGILLLWIELAVDIVVLHGDARMVHLRIVPVGDKQHIADQGIKALFQIDAVRVFFSGKAAFYLSLRVKFRTHGIDVVVQVLYESIPDLLGTWAEHLVEHEIVDERARHEVLLEI